MTLARFDAENVWQEATIGSITSETANCRSFQLHLNQPQPALPGQYAVVGVSVEGVEHLRCYSLSSVAGIDEHPKITIKRKPNGLVSRWMNDDARPNDTIKISRPFGKFVVRPGTTPLVFCAAGSGITPIFAMIRSALECSRRNVTLLDVNRNPEDVIFASDLQSMVRAHPDRLRVEYAFTADTGRVPDALLSRTLSGVTDPDVYLCGPPGFMESCARVAASLAIDPANVFSERFDVDGDLEDLDGPLLRLFMQGSDGARISLYSPEGSKLLHTLQQSGVRHIGICGGQASCGTCRVTIEAPWNATLAPPNRSERRLLAVLSSPKEAHRLACQVSLTRAHSDLVFAHAPSMQGIVDD